MGITIGKIAEATGLGVQTLRYYEREGLIDPPARSASGYRTYESDVVTRLNFIRRAQNLGFTLKEIRELIELHYTPSADCTDVGRVAQSKLRDVEKKIEDLQQMRDTLRQMIGACRGGSTSDCSVIACFTSC